MKQPCGCCAGIEIVTPESLANRPGLPALAYRAGTYATFFETMLARLSNLYPRVPQLTTRDPADPSIALLDAWAIVADVLTFYQERIANEGFLRTATERRSILELARLVGYRLRPGVASSVYLAFTVSNDFKGEIPAGTRAQSIPGTGETAQFFETFEKLAARDVWNNLKPRLTRPQVITLSSNPVTGLPATIDQGTDATTRDTIYFHDISTNLKTGDALLIVAGDGPGQQVLRFVRTVDAQTDHKRTEVTLQEPPPQLQKPAGQTSAQQAVATLLAVLSPFITDASNLFPGSDLAEQVAVILNGPPNGLIFNAQTFVGNNQQAAATGVANMVQAKIPQIQERRDIAATREFTRLESWVANILDVLTSLVEQLPSLDHGDEHGGLVGVPVPVRTPRRNLFGIVDQLALPPSLQPANSFRLARSVQQTFASESDAAPRLLAAFKPAIAATLYKAWAGVQTPSSQIKIYAMRTKASLFGYNAPLKIQLSNGNITGATDWPVVEKVSVPVVVGVSVPVAPRIRHEQPNVINLDTSYEKILPNSWIVVQTPDSTITKQNRLYAKAINPTAGVARGDYGMSGKTTVIELGNPLAGSRDIQWITADLNTVSFPRPNNDIPPEDDFKAIRQTVVYAQPEEMRLAEEPLDRDVEGNTVELDGLYDGLQSGRWIVVSGNRTDIPNVSGVTGSELVMIAGVNQGSGKQDCLDISLDTAPFASVYYVTGANAAGDRLVVGVPNKGFAELLSTIPLPSAPNQEICSPAALAPGLYANVYLPTDDERKGTFTAFAELLVDPETNALFTIHGVIPPDRMDPSNPNNRHPVYAWRIKDITSGQETLHTNIGLANKLAYKYDASTVTLYGNVVKATHGQTVAEVLGNGDASQPFQKFGSHQSPLTYLPAATPAGAQSTLTVRVNEIEWHEADNLAALGPTGRNYITHTDDVDKTSVIFGNGQHGARPPTGSVNVKAAYRYGIGKAGNAKARQISQLATRPLGVQGVINPLPATGGADRDSPGQARSNTPIAVKALDRLVSVEDYADFARTYAGIGKASAARLSDGRRQLVHVTIAGADDIPIDGNSDLYRNLVQALHRFGDPFQAIQVCVRKVKLLVVSAGIRVLADYQWESVEPLIRAALLDAFGFDRRELGQSAFLSEAVSLMQGVEGVAYVDVRVFDAVPEDIKAEKLASLAGSLGPNPFVEADLAKVNPSAAPGDPCQRILPAELVFLTPDIPDTFILTEISG